MSSPDPAKSRTPHRLPADLEWPASSRRGGDLIGQKRWRRRPSLAQDIVICSIYLEWRRVPSIFHQDELANCTGPLVPLHDAKFLPEPREIFRERGHSILRLRAKPERHGLDCTKEPMNFRGLRMARREREAQSLDQGGNA